MAQRTESRGAGPGGASDVLSREVGYVRKPHGGRLRVALAFPNTYFVGMSNLGFQTVYRLFNELDDVVCERVFLPGRQELQSALASGKPIRTTPVAVWTSVVTVTIEQTRSRHMNIPPVVRNFSMAWSVSVISKRESGNH